MSDHQGLQTERMKTFQHKSNKHTLFFSSFGFHFPLFVKICGNWRGHTPAHLSPDPGNYTALQPISKNVSLPPPSFTLMLRLERGKYALQCWFFSIWKWYFKDHLNIGASLQLLCPQPSMPVSTHYPGWAAPAPAPCQIAAIYGKMLIGTTRLFVNGAFCINQLTVGRGQQKLQKAMEISSKTSSKGRKSWMWKLMVRPGALWDVLERAREIFVFWFLTMVK